MSHLAVSFFALALSVAAHNATRPATVWVQADPSMHMCIPTDQEAGQPSPAQQLYDAARADGRATSLVTMQHNSDVVVVVTVGDKHKLSTVFFSNRNPAGAVRKCKAYLKAFGKVTHQAQSVDD